MPPDIKAIFDAAGVNSELHMLGSTKGELIQLSIATSLKRIADLLESVTDHHTYPASSICTREGKDRG